MFGSSRNTLIQNSKFSQSIYNQPGVTKGFDILARSVAPNAFHHSDDRPDPPKCHENTRVAVINKIMDWVMGKIDTDTFLWLYGPAGCGKTAIARTVAELCEKLDRLLASFFFFRTDSQRNTLKSFVASITYCIALVVPGSKPIIESAVEKDPLIFQYGLEIQLTKLVCEPLQKLLEQDHFCSTPWPRLIIVDGLDECLDEDAQVKLVSALAGIIRRHRLPLRILIASRPEQHLKYAFNTLNPHSTVFHLQLTDEYCPDDDIRRFLIDKFDAIKKNHPFSKRISMSPWPSEQQIESLVRKSSGQFIFASVAARFIDSPRHLPNERLDIVLELRPTDCDLPFSELDKLYRCILSRTCQVPLVVKMLGIYIALQQAALIVNRLCIIERLLALEDGKAGIVLAGIPSLLEIRGTDIICHHSSFIDFLLDCQRSKENYVDVSSSHAMILQYVLRSFRQGTLDQQFDLTTLKSFKYSRLTNIFEGVSLVSHLKWSISTSDLREDIENFALELYAERPGSRNTHWVEVEVLRQFADVLKESNYQDLHSRFCQRLEQFVTYGLESGPSPAKFQLVSTLFFVLPPNYLVSTTGHLRKIIFPAGSEPPFFWNDMWNVLCLEVFGLDSTESEWDQHTYLVLHFFPEGYEHANADGNRMDEVCEDGRSARTSPGIEPLDVHYGRVEATRKHVPESVLSHRLACVAIAFYQYLCDFGSAWKNFDRRSFLRKLRVETPSDEYEALQPLHISTYVKLAWALKILHCVLLVARKSDDLINHLSKTIIPSSVCALFPRSTRRVRRTIKAYLDKYQATANIAKFLSELRPPSSPSAHEDQGSDGPQDPTLVSRPMFEAISAIDTDSDSDGMASGSWSDSESGSEESNSP